MGSRLLDRPAPSLGRSGRCTLLPALRRPNPLPPGLIPPVPQGVLGLEATMIEPDSQSTAPDLTEVLANRKARGLSDRIPCLTPYVSPMSDDGLHEDKREAQSYG